MKRDEIISLLANRINQPHVIETYLKKVEITAYKKGVKDSLSSVWLVQQKESLINHGIYRTKADAEKYFNYNFESFVCVEIKIKPE